MLFKMAWETFPEERSNMMSSFRRAGAVEVAGVLDYGKQSRSHRRRGAEQPLDGIDETLGYEEEGRITAVLYRVLDRWGRQPARETPRRNRRGCSRTFRAGSAPAICSHRPAAGQRDRRSRRLAADADDEPRSPISSAARWIVAKSWKRSQATKELAVKLFELACVPRADLNDQFQYSPATRLIHLYKEAGRIEDARQLLCRAAASSRIQDGNYLYRLSRKAENLTVIGRLLDEMDQPVDALRVYRELVLKPRLQRSANHMYSGRSYEQHRSQARQGIEAALKKLRQSPAPITCRRCSRAGQKSPGHRRDRPDDRRHRGHRPFAPLDSPVISIIRPAV